MGHHPPSPYLRLLAPRRLCGLAVGLALLAGLTGCGPSGPKVVPFSDAENELS